MFGHGTLGWFLLIGAVWLVLRPLLLFRHVFADVIAIRAGREPAVRPLNMSVCLLSGLILALVVFAGVEIMLGHLGGWVTFLSVIFACVAFLVGIIGDMWFALKEWRFRWRILSWGLSKQRERLASPDVGERLRAAKIISEMHEFGQKAVPDLLTAMQDSDAEVRARSTLAILLVADADPELFAPMFSALKDGDLRVRALSAAVLVLMEEANPSEVVPILSEAVTHEDDYVALYAAQYLGMMGDQAGDGVQALRASIYDRTTINYASVTALAMIGSKAVPVLIELLSHSDDNIRWEASWFLGKITPAATEAIPALEELIALEPEHPVATTAKNAIWNIRAAGGRDRPRGSHPEN